LEVLLSTTAAIQVKKEVRRMQKAISQKIKKYGHYDKLQG
jgi:hypothetical protein